MRLIIKPTRPDLYKAKRALNLMIGFFDGLKSGKYLNWNGAAV